MWQDQPVFHPVQPVPQPVFEHHFNISPPESPRRVSILLGVGIFLMPYVFAWFTLREGYSTQARAISLGWAGFIILFNFIGIVSNPSRPSLSSTPSTNISSNVNTAQIEMQKATNAMANAANAVANAANLRTAVKQSPCADVESELAGVQRDQASVEEMLDATEDFGPQAGSPKKAIYLNALKRQGQLQLQRIALERKLKACGKRK